MTDLALARALHVVAVVLWIGGVAMVTTVLLPAVRSLGQAALFEEFERRFAAQSRVTTLLAGASGLYLLERLELWSRFSDSAFWWMHAMVAVWALFTLVLFVLEPFLLRRWLVERARRDAAGTMALAAALHWAMLALSMLAVAGAAAGSHGLL